LFTERVASSGYAGVVTHLVDADGRLWTVNAVTPGGPEQVTAALDGPVAIGEFGLSHRALGRSGAAVVRDRVGRPPARRRHRSPSRCRPRRGVDIRARVVVVAEPVDDRSAGVHSPNDLLFLAER